MSEITRAQLGLAPRDSVLLALKSVATMALADGLGLKHIEHLFRLAVVSQAMEQSRYNKCRASRLLKMHRNTLGRILHDSD
jgi:ActR/RegA family two-component response regulator